MTKAWLSGIAQTREAFSSLPEPNDEGVANALAVLRSDESDDEGMGFHKLKTVVQELADAQRILTEHGIELDGPQLQQVMKYVKELDERRSARSRFWVQVGVSALLAGAALAILGFTTPSDDLAKSLFGLVGVVAGYWLR